MLREYSVFVLYAETKPDFQAKSKKRILEKTKQTKMIVLFTKGKTYWDKNTENRFLPKEETSIGTSRSGQHRWFCLRSLRASQVILSPILGIPNSSKFKSEFSEVNIIIFVS